MSELRSLEECNKRLPIERATLADQEREYDLAEKYGLCRCLGYLTEEIEFTKSVIRGIEHDLNWHNKMSVSNV